MDGQGQGRLTRPRLLGLDGDADGPSAAFAWNSSLIEAWKCETHMILIPLEELHEKFVHDPGNGLALHPRGFTIANALYALIDWSTDPNDRCDGINPDEWSMWEGALARIFPEGALDGMTGEAASFGAVDRAVLMNQGGWLDVGISKI